MTPSDEITWRIEMIKQVLEIRVDCDKVAELIMDYVKTMTFKPSGALHFDPGGNAWVEVEA